MRLRHALSAAAMSVALAACGGGDADVDAAADTSAATTTAATATDDASEAVATPVVYDTVTGGQIDLGALEGQDTVLWFWAPW